MKSLLRNWKTTLAGLLSVAAYFVPAEYKELLNIASVTLLGAAAKDSNVTGN